MKLYQKILLAWFPLLIIEFVGVLVFPGIAWIQTGFIMVGGTSSLLGVVSFSIYRSEIRGEARFVFLNFGAFFCLNGIVAPLYRIMEKWLPPLNQWASLYFIQYQRQFYFMLLSISVLYLVVNLTLRKLSIFQKYLVVVVVVGCVWGCLFYPYILDPRYLYSTEDVQDYKAIRSAKEELQTQLFSNPSSKEIAIIVPRFLPESSKLGFQTSLRNREARVAEILPYFKDDDVYLLLYRPLWRSSLMMSLLPIISIVLFIWYQYRADPPKSAYLEKITWCLLLFCGFEALHHYAFIEVKLLKIYDVLNAIGSYASTAVMLALLSLLILRLRFIESVEGRFYERRLIQDASHITRWRDAFDNWVLHQFMNSTELEQRFLALRKDKPSKDSDRDRL